MRRRARAGARSAHRSLAPPPRGTSPDARWPERRGGARVGLQQRLQPEPRDRAVRIQKVATPPIHVRDFFHHARVGERRTATSWRIRPISSSYNARIRSKLLGAPTSIALATVRTDARVSYTPDRRYAGTTSLTLVAATNRRTCRPMRLAMRPAVRFPKLPLGTETIGSVAQAGQHEVIKHLRQQPARD